MKMKKTNKAVEFTFCGKVHTRTVYIDSEGIEQVCFLGLTIPVCEVIAGMEGHIVY